MRGFRVLSDCGVFPYGRPVGRFGSRSSAVRNAAARVAAGERAWVENASRTAVWGHPLVPDGRRVAGMEWWGMAHLETRPK